MPGNVTQSQGPHQLTKIADFTNGIVSNRNTMLEVSAPSRIPNAANQVSGSAATYGCMCIQSGGLLLGPTVIFASRASFASLLPAGATTMAVTGVVNDVDGGDSFFTVSSSGSSQKSNLYTSPFSGSGIAKVFADQTSVATSIGAMAFPFSAFLYDGSNFNNYVGVGNSYQNNSQVIIGTAYNGSPISATAMGSSANGFAFSVSGRLWLITNNTHPFSSSPTFPVYNIINYTDPTSGADDNRSFGGQATIVDYTSPSGFGAWGAFSSQLVLLVKTGSTGGVIVSGDIFNPTAITSPTIPGTNGLLGQSAMTPLGMIYRSNYNGVWAWNGGQAAQKMSVNLDDSTWQRGTSLGGVQGGSGFNCQYFHNMIFTDTGMFYDINTNSWWSLPPYLAATGTAPLYPNLFITDNQGVRDADFYCVQSDTGVEFVSTSYSFDASQAGVSFQPPSGYYHSYFESNPIQLSLDNIIEIQDISVVMQGYGTLTVGILPRNSSTFTERSIPITSSTFERYSITFSQETDVLVFNIGWVATSNIGPIISPIIESIEIKYIARYPVPVV